MNQIFSLKTILATLISTGTVIGLAALPVQGTENSDRSTKAELILSQNFDYGDFDVNQRYPSENVEPTDNLKHIIGLTGLVIGTGAIGYHLTKVNKPSLADPLLNFKQDNGILLDRISPKLRRELLRLVNNPQTANRLLSGTLMSHAGRSPNWAAEKVIYDLKRDRT